MTRDVEMEISLWEMVLSVKRHWVMVLIVAIVCMAAGGVFGYYRINNAKQDAVQDVLYSYQDNPENAESHQEFARSLYEESQKLAIENEEISKEMAPRLRKEWQRLKERYESHPFSKQDPYHCDRVRITVLFDKEAGNHDGMLYDWIMNADESKLFGEAESKLAPFKRDLISTGGGSYNSYEATVNFTAVDGFDALKAADYIKRYIMSKAKVAGFGIHGFTTSTDNTYNAAILNFQNDMISQMNNIQSTLTDMYNRSMTEVEPPKFEEVAAPVQTGAAQTQGVTPAGLAKYGLIGLVLGVFVGAAFAIFITLRQGCVLSRRQVEDTFGLELLSDCSKDNPTAIDILDANLGIMIGDKASVMLIGSSADDDMSDTVSKLNADSDRKYVAGRDIIVDSVTIDALSGVEGILLGLYIGKSRIADIQRLMLRAHKLDKKILGYVQL